MNKLGVHALVWAGDWSPASARHAIASTAQAGFDLIEIPLLDPSAVDAALTRRLLDEHGIEATCSLGLRADADISSADPEVAERGRALLDDALRVTRDVGSTFLGGVLYSALAKYPAPATAATHERIAESLGALADRAARDGITLGVEAVNRYETNVVNTAEQALGLLDAIGAANVRVHLDTYHMNIEEDDLAGPVERCGERLGYAHVGENHRGALGSGHVDFEAFFRALHTIGYDGPIAFESFSSAVVDPLLSTSLAVWRNLWDDGMALAVGARRFIQDGLAAAADARV